MQYWLMKTEPTAYSIDDLKKEKVGMWDGVRNYQARNFMRDMRKGDKVLFYHSSCDPAGVVGTAEVVREAYPDPTQFNTKEHHFDPKSTKQNPRWDVVDIRFKKKFKDMVTLGELRNDPRFAGMPLLKRGSRLSVQPVAKKHFEMVIQLGS